MTAWPHCGRNLHLELSYNNNNNNHKRHEGPSGHRNVMYYKEQEYKCFTLHLPNGKIFIKPVNTYGDTLLIKSCFLQRVSLKDKCLSVLTSQQKEFWHRAGEKERRQSFKPALPVLLCLWEFNTPGVQTLFLYLPNTKIAKHLNIT